MSRIVPTPTTSVRRSNWAGWMSVSTVCSSLFGAAAPVTGEVAQLPQNNKQSDTVDEAGHDRIRDEASQPTHAKEAKDELNGAGEQR